MVFHKSNLYQSMLNFKVTVLFYSCTIVVSCKSDRCRQDEEVDVNLCVTDCCTKYGLDVPSVVCEKDATVSMLALAAKFRVRF